MIMEAGGIGKNNIHPTAVIGLNVTMGSNNYIGPYCYIDGNTTIGSNNRFEAFCSIGTPAEHIGHYYNTEGQTTIGDNNLIKEYVSIHQGTTRITRIGNNVHALRGSHIGHDSIVENHINIACNVMIGGFSYVMEGCNFGLGSIVHQYTVVGAYSMIGMGAVITKQTSIPPGNVYIGNPARFLKRNTYGLNKYNVSEDNINLLIKKYEDLLHTNVCRTSRH